MNLIGFKPAEGFSSETDGAWRYMKDEAVDPHPYFVLDNEEDQACGIRCFDPIFGTNLIICQGNRNECEQYVKREFSKWDTFEIPRDEYCYAWHIRDGRNSVIWLSVPDEECGAKIISSLAHEALHCAFETSKFIGITPSNSSEEFYTYYMQWVMNQYLDCLGYNPEKEKANQWNASEQDYKPSF